MRKARKILARSEPEIFVDTINLQDLPVSALAHVVAGAELEHRWLPEVGPESLCGNVVSRTL
jgi:hypothetical protein